MGKDAPADVIIASLSAGISLVMLPALVPLFHRLPRRTQVRVLLALVTGQAAVVAFLASPLWSPYDRMHPKRIALQYHYNVSSMGGIFIPLFGGPGEGLILAMRVPS